MKRAYQGDETRQLVLDLGLVPFMPPHPDASHLGHTTEPYIRRCNGVERRFKLLNGHRGIFSRFDKRDVMFTDFIRFALIAEALK